MRPSDRVAVNIVRMILAAVSFGFMATFVKLSCRTLPSMEVVFFRSFLGSIAIGAMILKEKTSWIGLNPKIMILRGITGFAALSLHFYAIKELNLGTAVMLNYTAPIFVVILARLMLGEKTIWIVKASILFSFVGLYLLVAPQFDVKPTPVLLGICSGIFAAVAYVLIRYNGEKESPYTIIFYFTAISTIGSLPFLPGSFHWPNASESLLLVGVTAGAFFGQVWLTSSIQGSPISAVLPFSYLTPVFAMLVGTVLLKEYLSFEMILGSLIIVGSGVVIYLFRKRTVFIPIEE